MANVGHPSNVVPLTCSAPLPVNAHASDHDGDHRTAMYPNNGTLGERLRLFLEENFHDA